MVSAASMLTFFGVSGSRAETTPLREVLTECPANSQLSITLADTQQFRGQYLGATQDSLTLQLGDQGLHLRQFAITDIVRVRRWHSDAGKTAQQVGVAGGIILGGLGLLVGLAASQYEGEGANGAVFLATGLGLSFGFATGGLLGAGIGALSHSWYDIWPVAPVKALQPPDPHSRNTRLNLVAGVGHSSVAEYEVTRFSGRVALLKNTGSFTRLGPEFSHVAFGGAQTVTESDGSVTEVNFESISRVALAIEASPSHQGLLPYFSLGVGASLANEMKFGGYLGGGMRSRRASGAEFDIDLRYNFNFDSAGVGDVGSYWTVGIGFGFGL